MKNRFSPLPGNIGAESPPDHQGKIERSSDGANNRVDPRCALANQAFVAIPSLASRAYEIREISRSGMFLGFKDARSTWLELEQSGVEPGVYVDIAFAVSLSGARNRFSVRARIARITKQGIGVQFTTRNPPQLSALRELFSGTGADQGPVDTLDSAPKSPEKKRILSKPAPENSAWNDWDLMD